MLFQRWPKARTSLGASFNGRVRWVTDRGTVQWIAFRNREVLDRGEEPFRNQGQVGQARDRIRRLVEGL